MYRILDSLNGKVYQELVSLLIKRSDSFLFHLPNMGKTVVNHRNAPFMTGYPIGYSKEKDQDLHLAYMKWVKRYIDLIRDDIIQSHTDTGYLDQISSIEMEVYHVAISERTSGFFGQTDDFSKWM
ncbi:MAG: hypothetical protein IJ036_01300, partial [Lachnospiraceae bacterium]|nr:hypothetical protein [Lachnospiraceae bacterium]